MQTIVYRDTHQLICRMNADKRLWISCDSKVLSDPVSIWGIEQDFQGRYI
jgi:hypothetical protein